MEWWLRGVSYTSKAISKQMKATTALQNIDQYFKLLSYSMMIMDLKFFKVCSFQLTLLCILHRGNDFIFEYLRKKTKSSQSTSNGTRRSNLMQKTNIQKSRDTVPLRWRLVRHTCQGTLQLNGAHAQSYGAHAQSAVGSGSLKLHPSSPSINHYTATGESNQKWKYTVAATRANGRVGCWNL